MANNMFASSFFRLPKEPHNYGDRMEYTQIEMIACGAVPVFDIHFGQHNKDKFGTRYFDVDRLAVWSDRSDLRGTAEAIIALSNNAEEMKRYRDAGYEFIKQEFDSETVLIDMFEFILATGKDENKFDSDSLLLEHLYGHNQVFEKFNEILAGGEIPATNFKQIKENLIAKFVNKARVPVVEFKQETTKPGRKKKQVVSKEEASALIEF